MGAEGSVHETFVVKELNVDCCPEIRDQSLASKWHYFKLEKKHSQGASSAKPPYWLIFKRTHRLDVA